MPDARLFLDRRSADASGPGVQIFDLPLRPVIQRLFGEHDELVVFLPVGAAVRLLAPVLQSKRRDPAVVCVDDAGRFAVSVLSGHVGGADDLARRVATAIGAQAVITSASDALDVMAVDLVGRAQGWRIEAPASDLTRAAAAVVNGEPVALWLDPETGAGWPEDAPLSPNVVLETRLDEAAADRYAATLIVSDRVAPVNPGHALVVYRPPTIAVGLGCRRGVAAEHLAGLLDHALRQHGLSKASIAKIATADIKADEPGILSLAESLGLPLVTFTGDELNACGRDRSPTTDDGAATALPTPSAARDLLGIFGVSEPAAMLAAGAATLLVPRTKSDRATVAMARLSISKND